MASIKDLYDSVGKLGGKIKSSLSDLNSSQTTYTSPAVAPSPISYSIPDRGVNLTDKDFESIRPLIYGEISNRTPDKQELESHVILNTALNRMKEYSKRGQNKSLSDIVAMPNQYQAYGGQQYNLYGNPPDAVAQKKKQQVDAIVDKIRDQVKTGSYPDNTGGAFYYIHNPDGTITYDNKKPLFAK